MERSGHGLILRYYPLSERTKRASAVCSETQCDYARSELPRCTLITAHYDKNNWMRFWKWNLPDIYEQHMNTLAQSQVVLIVTSQTKAIHCQNTRVCHVTFNKILFFISWQHWTNVLLLQCAAWMPESHAGLNQKDWWFTWFTDRLNIPLNGYISKQEM
jgi:hypothetical protein